MVTADKYRVSFWGDENVLELGSGDGCTTLEYTKNYLKCTLKIVIFFFYSM